MERLAAAPRHTLQPGTYVVLKRAPSRTLNLERPGITSQGHPPTLQASTTSLKDPSTFLFERFQVPGDLPGAPRRCGLTRSTPWIPTVTWFILCRVVV